MATDRSRFRQSLCAGRRRDSGGDRSLHERGIRDDEAFGGLPRVSVDRAYDPHDRSIGAVVEQSTLDHRDPRRDLSRNRLPLRLVPVENEELVSIFLDQIAVHRDGRMGSGKRNGEE